MKVLHIVSEYGSKNRGVPQKVVRTVDAWKRFGIEADFINFASAQIGNAGLGLEDSFKPRFRGEWIVEMHRRTKKVLEVLKQAKPDLVYTREMVWSPGFLSIMNEFKVVIEVNSDRGNELRSNSLAAAAFWNMTSKSIHRRAAGLICVTNELAEKFGLASIPTTVIANAVEVPKVLPKRSLSSNRPLVLMLVGSPSSWIGLDRFSALSELLPEFDFVICGDLRAYAGKISETVRVMPPCNGKVLEELLSKTCVSFGTLALSRNGMVEACPLKSRTSLAAGIPLIYAYKDPALKGNEPFALRIEDRQQQTSSTLVKITNFIKKASVDPDLGLKAWKFAQNNLDIDILEKRRIRFFNSIIES